MCIRIVLRLHAYVFIPVPEACAQRCVCSRFVCLGCQCMCTSAILQTSAYSLCVLLHVHVSVGPAK